MILIRSFYIFSTMVFATQVFSAHAQSTDAATEASLRQAINAYDAATEARDFEQIVAISLPPKILAIVMNLPEASDADIEGARTEMIGALETGYASIEDFNYEYDLTNLDIFTTSSGLNYALLPTVTTISLRDLNLKSTGTTLALFDEDQWFLLNSQDEESISWFRQAYPSLETVDLQPNQMEVVQ